jgi:hypothetical protein
MPFHMTFHAAYAMIALEERANISLCFSEILFGLSDLFATISELGSATLYNRHKTGKHILRHTMASCTDKPKYSPVLWLIDRAICAFLPLRHNR